MAHEQSTRNRAPAHRDDERGERATITHNPDPATEPPSTRGPKSVGTAGPANDQPESLTLAEALWCLNNVEQAVLLYLRAASFRSDIVTIGSTEIAQRTGFSYPAVKTALWSMKAQGVIECIERGTSRMKPSTWRLLLAPDRPPSRKIVTDFAGDEVDAQSRHAGEESPPALPRWAEPPASVNELCDRYVAWSSAYYRDAGGEPSKSVNNIIIAATFARRAIGDENPATLRAEHLCAIQDWILANARGRRGARTCSRRYVNDNLAVVRRMLKWATRPPQRWLPAEVLIEAQLVETLKYGRSGARESEPIRPVPWQDVQAIFPYISRHVRAMILVQWFSGCRPGEVCTMKPRELDRSHDEVWLYRPEQHKTKRFGKARIVPLNRDVQKVLLPFLNGRDSDAYIFSPAEVIQEFHSARHEARKTPLQWGNRPGSNVKHCPARKPRPRYDVVTYRWAIHRACDRAFPPPMHLQRLELPGGKRETASMFEARLSNEERAELKAWQVRHRWSPNQLRHSAATRIREKYGIEAAQMLLGHSRLNTTEIYAEASVQKLIRMMAQEAGE